MPFPAQSLTPRPPLPRWLIAIAYFLAGGFIKSGLGNRIAYAIVSTFGKTTLGLVYSLVRGSMGALGLEENPERQWDMTVGLWGCGMVLQPCMRMHGV